MDDDIMISRYTRANAIADGVLIETTEQARDTGILLPTAITAHLHQVLEDIPAKSAGRDWRGRLHDVLWMTFLKLRSMQKNQEEEFPAELNVIIDDVMQTLWAVIDGDGLTIMYPRITDVERLDSQMDRAGFSQDFPFRLLQSRSGVSLRMLLGFDYS
jgi:hypothetical protein